MSGCLPRRSCSDRAESGNPPPDTVGSLAVALAGVQTTNTRRTGVANAMDKTWWKVIGGVGTVLAGNVAKNALEKSYTGVTGKIPPHNPEDPDVDWTEALTWAVVSGVVMAI